METMAWAIALIAVLNLLYAWMKKEDTDLSVDRAFIKIRVFWQGTDEEWQAEKEWVRRG